MSSAPLKSSSCDNYSLLEKVPCPLCNSRSLRTAYEAYDLNMGVPGTFTVVRCLDCSLHFLNPRPTEDSLSSFYPKIYSQGYEEGISPRHLKTYQNRLNFVLSKVGKGSLLEVGSAAGHFLKLARDNGFSVEGLEMDDRTRAFALEHYSLTVHSGTLERANLKTNCFDTVCMFDVFEHLLDPKVALEKILQVLKPGGSIIIQVPNIDCPGAKIWGKYWYGADIPRDIMYLSPATMRSFLVKSGFSNIEIVHKSEPHYFAHSLIKFVGVLIGRSSGTVLATTTGSSEHIAANKGLKIFVFSLMNLMVAPFSKIAAFLGFGSAIFIKAEKPR